MKKLLVALPVLSGLLVAVACGGDDPQSNPGPNVGADGGVDGAGGDGATPEKPKLDPKTGSFAAARTKTETVLQQARDAGLRHPNRLMPTRDPLLVVNALQELQRSTSADCKSAQFGCPDPQTAVALLTEYQRNKAALGTALKSTLALQQGWSRLALASLMLGYLNILEQAKGMTPEEARDVLAAAKTFQDTLDTSPIKPSGGMYPDVPAGSTLYRFAFGQIAPAPVAPAAAVTAANTFIDAVLARLGVLAIGPKPEDPFKGLVQRVKQGIIVQGIIVQGIIVQGSEAAQVFDALPYFYSYPSGAQAQKVDTYLTGLDDLIDKTSKGTTTFADWSAFAPKADELNASLDYAAGALGASMLLPSPVASALKDVTEDLENDPNVQERKVLIEPTEAVMYEPVLTLRTWPALAPADRRVTIDLPADVPEIALAPRSAPSLGADLAGDPAGNRVDKVHVAWGVDYANVRIDHIDLRVENTTTKKTVFHKVYRVNPTTFEIAVRTAIPLKKEWFGPGTNDLQVQIVAVDRLGYSSGIVCGSLAVENDNASPWGVVPNEAATAGKCFTKVSPTDVTPLGLEGVLGGYDIVMSKTSGSPYRPGLLQSWSGSEVRIYNDTPTKRRVRSLFTPEYAEFLPIDPVMGKGAAVPAGVAPIDSGDIAPGAIGAMKTPDPLPAGFRYTLVDETNAAKVRLVVQAGAYPRKLLSWP